MINLNNFLAREQLERLFLQSQFLFGNLIGFRKLRKWRIAILRSLATILRAVEYWTFLRLAKVG